MHLHAEQDIFLNVHEKGKLLRIWLYLQYRLCIEMFCSNVCWCTVVNGLGGEGKMEWCPKHCLSARTLGGKKRPSYYRRVKVDLFLVIFLLKVTWEPLRSESQVLRASLA